jgi:Flp pilus assembly protein CpaB
VQDGSKRRARLILIMGVLLAIIAGAGTFVIANGAQTAPPPVVPTKPVLVAAREIPAKTTLTAADVRLQNFNVDAAPLTALSDSKAAIGQITVQNISVGEPILPGKFADPKKPTFVVIPPDFIGPDGAPAPNSPNYRAMSITVPDAAAVGGAITVGDIVDVLYTLNFDPKKYIQSPKPEQVPDFSAKIILERVPILARTASVYTIRVDTITAERIGYLQASGGTIVLLLRAPKDERASGSVGTTFEDIERDYKLKIPALIKQ